MAEREEGNSMAVKQRRPEVRTCHRQISDNTHYGTTINAPPCLDSMPYISSAHSTTALEWYILQFQDFQHNSTSYIRLSSFYLMLANDTEIKNIKLVFAHVFLTLNVPSPGKHFFPYSYMYIVLILFGCYVMTIRGLPLEQLFFCLLNLPIL